MTVGLRTRLVLLYLALFAVIVAAWSLFVVVLVRADLYSGIDRALGSRASEVALSLSSGPEARFRDVTQSTLVGVAPTEATAQLLSRSGAVLQSSGDTLSAGPILDRDAVTDAYESGTPRLHTVTDRGGEHFRIMVVRMPGADRLLVVGTSTESADNTLGRLMLIELVTGPLVLLLAGVFAWLLARRALLPLARMTAIADSIGIEALGERVPVPASRDELSALASTFNHMLERLESGVRVKRRLVADASHELQTPLAVMRTELDVSLASDSLPREATEVLESAREETDRMARIVRNLLTLARFDEGTLLLLRQEVDLRALVADVAATLSTLARDAGVDVTVGGFSVVVPADPEYLRVALVNLLENAIKYSGRGSSACLTVASAEGTASVRVSDTGPGIPVDALPLVFDRFYRVDGSRSGGPSGSGLGLAISREIAIAHGGRLDVESRVGDGSCFTLVLPRA